VDGRRAEGRISQARSGWLAGWLFGWHAGSLAHWLTGGQDEEREEREGEREAHEIRSHLSSCGTADVPWLTMTWHDHICPYHDDSLH
jgi:hypothetical protein